MLNNSDDDFASPIVFKKLKPAGKALNTGKNGNKSNQMKKKPKKKQVTLDQMLRENPQITDTNEEHLQMALALSKSTSEMLNQGNEEEDNSWSLNSAMNKPDVKRTLLEFGFKSDRSKMNVENRLKRIALAKNKKSKFRFITPILSLRTEEERQTLIQSKISLILSRNTETVEGKQEIHTPKVTSIQLNEIKCSECSIFRLNHNLDKCPRNNFKVSELNISDERAKCGSLLKDWKKIAMRDHTPERHEIPSQSKDCSLDVDNDTEKFELSLKQDVAHKDMIQKSTLKVNNILSPDLFDETILIEKSELFEISSKIKKNLSCIFSDDKLDLEKESCQGKISDSFEGKEKIHSSDAIYHFDGYDTDDDILCLSSSSNDEDERKGIKIKMNNQVSREKSQSFNHKNDLFSHEKYHSSSDDHEINEADMLSKSDFTPENIGDILHKTVNGSGIFKGFNEEKSVKCDVENAYIILDSDEESTSTQNLNFGADKIETDPNSCDFAKAKVMEMGFDSKITEFVDSELEKSVPNENLMEERKYGCDSDEHRLNTLTKNDSIKFKTTDKSQIFNENKHELKEISSNEHKSNDTFQLSPLLSYSNLNQVSYRNSMSMNITEHIEEILAGSYSQIDTLPLSDYSTNLNSNNSTITKELNNIMTEKNESLNKNSMELGFTDSSSEIICISDDEVNYSCANDKIESNERLFKKYSSFVETPKRKETSLIRHKSDSCITPKRNMIIKTDNITPMIEYDALNTPDIVKELDKFGLKPLKRKRGINLLKYIYEATHPTVERSQVIETEQATKRMKINECTDSNTFKRDKIQQILDNTWINSIHENEIIFEKKRSSKIHTCNIPLQIVWHNFLIENPHIYENILRYEPVQVEEIHKMLKGQGFKFHLQDLITFFDRKCITIRVPQNHTNKNKS